MYHVKAKFISIVLVTMLISINSIGQPNKQNKMEQVYYTQEGKPYVLKTANIVLLNQVIPVLPNVKYSVRFQQDAIPDPLLNPLCVAMPIQASKAVVPLMLFYSVFDNAGLAQIATVATPYYSSTPPLPIGNQIKTISKILPNVELIFRLAANPTNFIQHGLKYNQVVLSDDDFTTINPFAQFSFSPNYSGAFSPLSVGGINLTASPDAVVSVSVLYFQFL